jgi:2-acylglycerol O-acyltransferase 2
MEKKNKKFILAATPHGVISFTGMCSAVYCIPQFRNINTAAASAVLQTPLLKHVMGIFGLIDANGKNLEKHFKKDGVKGSCVLYVGGIAELFKSSRKEERLYLQGRKGFIKMALKNGVDIIPLYLFGNTSVLTVMKNRTLEGLSRKLQASVTYFWGSYGLPIPRPNKILYVRGRPLGFPKIDNPTQEDIDKWHKVYVDEVVRIFETYRGELADYSKKEIFVE